MPLWFMVMRPLPCSVTKGSTIEKNPSGRALVEGLNLWYDRDLEYNNPTKRLNLWRDLDLEHNNPGFSENTSAYDNVQSGWSV